MKDDKNHSQYMRTKSYKINSENISIEILITGLNAVVSMEIITLGNEICLQFSLHENQYFIDLILGELSRTYN